MFANEHGRFMSGYNVRRVFFTYVECERCSGLYCPIFYEQAQLNQLWAHQPENVAEAPLSARKRTQEGYARTLMRHCRTRGSCLEIGGDIGLFADACAQAGRFDRLFLYEPSLDVHGELTQRLASRDLTIRHAPFRAADVPARSVFAAAMIHVLDHVLGPLSVMCDIREVLPPGEVSLVVVHNSRSLLARVLGKRWPPLALQHPHLFSPRSLTRLFQSAGLECLGIRGTINYFPATHFVRAALAILGFRPDAFPAWDRPLAGPPLGNIIAVARGPM
jgi:hypothetical protein